MSKCKKVLVVDDNHDLADGVATILEMDGYITDVVYTGRSAVSALVEGQFDLALIDIKMPDISGLQVFSECCDVVNTEFVFMTGFRVEQILLEIYKQYDISIVRADKKVKEVLSDIFDGGESSIKIVIGNDALTNQQLTDYCDNSDLKIFSINSDGDVDVPDQYDFILIDLNKPMINSVILLDRIKNMIADRVNIIVLVRDDENDCGNVLLNSFSMTGCLFKPVNPDTILSVVRNKLDVHVDSKAGVTL